MPSREAHERAEPRGSAARLVQIAPGPEDNRNVGPAGHPGTENVALRKKRLHDGESLPPHPPNQPPAGAPAGNPENAFDSGEVHRTSRASIAQPFRAAQHGQLRIVAQARGQMDQLQHLPFRAAVVQPLDLIDEKKNTAPGRGYGLAIARASLVGLGNLIHRCTHNSHRIAVLPAFCLVPHPPAQISVTNPRSTCSLAKRSGAFHRMWTCVAIWRSPASSTRQNFPFVQRKTRDEKC